MRITDVEPGFVFEGENPQFAQLQHLLTTAKEPWERNQIKWRIKNLRDAETLAGEPGAGMGAPRDARGNYIPVLPTKEWMARNPSIVKTLPSDCLPPSMQQPSIIDKAKKAWDNWTPAYKKAADDLRRSREEQGLGNFEEETDPALGDIGDLDQNDIANIQNPDAFEWQALRNQIIDAKQKGVAPEEIAKLQAQYDQLAGGKADAWEQTYAKVQAQKAKDQEQYPGKVQYVQESIELDRIKHLSKVLRG
jgi:hypothetical protein